MSLNSKIEPATINIYRDITKCLTCNGFFISKLFTLNGFFLPLDEDIACFKKVYLKQT